MTITKTLPPITEDEDRKPNGCPFEWEIQDGSEGWTNDPSEIAYLSDAPIIDGLLRTKEVATVVGAAKTAKTWFSLALALNVSAGTPFLGMPTHQRKTLYLDYELKEGTFRKRMSLLATERPSEFFYQCLRGKSRLPRVDEIATLVDDFHTGSNDQSRAKSRILQGVAADQALAEH